MCQIYFNSHRPWKLMIYLQAHMWLTNTNILQDSSTVARSVDKAGETVTAFLDGFTGKVPVGLLH